MKESFWRVTSLILTVVLIVVVASWATATPGDKNKQQKDKVVPKKVYADDLTRKGIVVEQNRQRFLMFSGGSRGTDNEKLILFDSWDVANTKDVWMMKNPHTEAPKWVRIPFDRK